MTGCCWGLPAGSRQETVPGLLRNSSNATTLFTGVSGFLHPDAPLLDTWKGPGWCLQRQLGILHCWSLHAFVETVHTASWK